jgi:hypothetical protein
LCHTESLIVTNIKQTVVSGPGYTRKDRYHADIDIGFTYLRIPLNNTQLSIDLFEFDAIQEVDKISDVGLLIRGFRNGKPFTLWLPDKIAVGKLDEYGRLVESDDNAITYTFQINKSIRFVISKTDTRNNDLFFGFISAGGPSGRLLDELKEQQIIEQQRLIKANWFSVRHPANIWNYLIDGSIYDPLPGRGSQKRYKCQQCAYAWWTYFGLLFSRTGKNIYSILQDELSFSINADLGQKGEWLHGAWSDDMEVHTRFQLDGIQLFISQFEKSKDNYWISRAENAMAYLLKKMVAYNADDSLWFLHDSTVDKNIHRIKGRLFGRNAIHSFTINTHVQALFVLLRLKEYSEERDTYDRYYYAGIKALRAIFEQKPAEYIYRNLIPWFTNHRLRGISGNRKEKVLKLIEKKSVNRFYWYLRKKYPRIVYPNGLTERDLTLTFIPFNYHIINIKDLLILYSMHKEPWLVDYIRNGVGYIKQFVRRDEFVHLLHNDLNYVEVAEIFKIYARYIDPGFDQDLKYIEDQIYKATGGYSLDAVLLN